MLLREGRRTRAPSWDFASLYGSPSNHPDVVAGAANVLGAWTEIIASTPAEVSALGLCHPNATWGASGQNWSALMDIGIGPSGSEIPIIDNIAVGGAHRVHEIPVPLRIPQGSRVSARVRCATSGATFSDLSLVPLDDGFYDFSACTTYGADTATSGGTAPAAPGSVNNDGAWTQLTAATTEIIRGIFPTFTIPNTGTVLANTAYCDIGMGGSGSEVELIGSLRLDTTTGEIMTTIGADVVPIDIPIGTRLVWRYRPVTTVSSAGAPRCCLHTFR